MSAMACPHKDIRFCPLYLAAHMASGFGCDDGNLGSGECAVARGLNYETAVARFAAAHPRLVAVYAFNEAAWEAQQQRQRNMRAAGIH